jgi:hypothetical protein
MKILTLFAAWTALVIMAVSLESKAKSLTSSDREQRKTPQWSRPIHALTQSINV